jgi:hypothetical protein
MLGMRHSLLPRPVLPVAATVTVSKEVYLLEFEPNKNGPLHEQEFVKKVSINGI